jgi:EmrB/QacA subfamily drug resistance transporter
MLLARGRAAGSGRPPAGRRLGLLLTGLTLSVLLEAVDQTIVATALPRIAGSLHGAGSYAWVVTAYLLAAATVIPLAGKLSDQIGRAPVLIPGTALFLAGSVLAATAPTMAWLIAWRAVQGLGAGTGVALVNTVIGDLFPPARRARWQALFVAAYGLSSVAGPGLGGWLAGHGPALAPWVTAASRWRWIFLVNLPVGAVALPALIIGMHGWRAQRPRGARHLDVAGALACAGATAALILGITSAGAAGRWGAPRVLVPLGLAAAGYAAFGWREARAAEPVLPLGLLRNRVLAACFGLSLLVGAALFAIVLCLPLYVQGVLGASPARTGLALTPLSVAFVAGAAAAGGLAARLGRYRPQVLAGALLTVTGTVLLAWPGPPPGLAGIAVRGAIANAGIGMFFPVLQVAAQNAAGAAELGVVTAGLAYWRQIGQVLGTALGTGVVLAVADRGAGGRAAPALDAMLARGGAADDGPAARAVRHALAGGLHAGFLATAAVAVLIAVTAAWLPDARLAGRPPEPGAGRAGQDLAPAHPGREDSG